MNGMRQTVLAMMLIGLTAGPAGAAPPCSQSWCRRAEALVQRWLGEPASRNGDVVAPPQGIDPQMALAPPGPQGALRVIHPRHRPQQR
jgi:hypothetical protein